MDFIKNNIWQLLFLGLIIFVFATRELTSCNLRTPVDTAKAITKTDTFKTQVSQPPVIIPIYVPQTTSSQAPIVIPPTYQPSKDYEALLKQYNELATKFLTINSYKDSILLRDSTGQRIGVVNLNDDVQKNEIIKRSPNYQLSFPKTIIKSTTTITLPPERKTQVYIGGGLSVSPSLLTNATVDAGLLLKTKNDQIFGIKGGIITMGNQVVPQVGISSYWKIKLKK